MSMLKETPPRAPRRAAPIGALLFSLGLLLIMGIGYLAVRNIATGLVLTPPSIAGEWQAYRKDWRLKFDQDKTVVSSTGHARSNPTDPETTIPAASISGTYKIDFFGTLWVTLSNGQVYTSTLRPELPNQFDVIDAATDVVTVFERVRILPPMPDDLPASTPKRSPSRPAEP
jgi:hypothetical protein